MKERTFGTKDRYGFNGKENDDETETTDFGARIYNGDLAIFLSVDPLTKKFPNLSPYMYSENSPIVIIDKEGESGVAYTTDKKNENGKPILRVVSNVYIYGEGAKNVNTQTMQSNVMAQYNNDGKYFNANVDGTDYEVHFEINVTVIDEKDVEAKLVEGGNSNLNVQKPVKLTTENRFKLTTQFRFKLTT